MKLEGPPRNLITLPLIVLAIAAGLALVWYSAPSLLLLFAGILFAAFLDACTRGVGYVLPLRRPTRYAAGLAAKNIPRHTTTMVFMITT